MLSDHYRNIFDKEKYDVRVMLPKYMCMKDEWKEKLQYHTFIFIWT